jgi:hypothetical protein
LKIATLAKILTKHFHMKSYLLRSFAFAALVSLSHLMLTSCVHQAVSKKFNKYQNNKNGLIIGTVTFPKNIQWFDKYYFRIKSDHESAIEFTINSYENANSPTPTNDYCKTYVFIVEKKAGKYAIDHVRLFANDPEEASYYGWVKDFSIPIEVKQGEITYIGDILYLEDVENRKMQMSIHDQFSRDLKYFKIKDANINWESANKSIVQPVYN